MYAGAYTYGKTRYERYVDEHGAVKKRIRHLPMDQWAVLIPDHHPGFIDWATFQANQARLDSNTRPQPHQAGGAVREGSALLQGIATCGHCGRRLRTHYRGRNSTPGYHCAGKDIVDGRGVYCLNIGGLAIEQAVANAFLDAVTPAAVEATIAHGPTTPSQPRRRACAVAAGRSNACVMRLNEPSAVTGPWSPKTGSSRAAWKPNGRTVCAIWPPPKRNCAAGEQQQPSAISPEQLKRIQTARLRSSSGLEHAPTTTDRDRKELLRTLAGRSDRES